MAGVEPARKRRTVGGLEGHDEGLGLAFTGAQKSPKP